MTVFGPTDQTTADQQRPIARVPWIVLGALMLLRTVLLFGGDGLTYAVLRLTGSSTGTWSHALLFSNAHIVLTDVATVAVLFWLCRREGLKVTDLLGLVRRGRDLLVGLALGVGLIIAFYALTYLVNLGAMLLTRSGPPAGSALQVPLWLGVWSILVIPVTIAIAEELLYRGYLLPHVAARIGWWPAALVVSFAFGLQHAAFSATSVEAVLTRVLTLFGLGIGLSVLARWLKRLVPLIIGHWMVDVVGLGLPMLMAGLAR